MYTEDDVIIGIINYIKEEVIRQLPDYAKLMAGAALLHNTNRIGEMLRGIGNGQMLRTIDLVNDSGEIDVDIWCRELRQAMDSYCGGKVEVRLPMLAPMTFRAADIDTLKRYLKHELG